MRNKIDAFIREALLVKDTGELKRLFLDFLSKFDFDAVAYQYLTAGFKSLSLSEGFRISTFPEGHIRYYIDNKCFEIDPILLKARKSGVPFLWLESIENLTLSQRQIDLIASGRKHGLLSGAGVPVYALPGDVAYFSIGSTTKEFDISRAQLLELQAACQNMHSRYNELTRDAKIPKLSKREVQVLELIAQGNPNSTISENLGVSPNTVDTVIRRCFEKLGVTSRVEAALAGVSMGLILP